MARPKILLTLVFFMTIFQVEKSKKPLHHSQTQQEERKMKRDDMKKQKL
jgi:hypothetical protein